MAALKLRGFHSTRREKRERRKRAFFFFFFKLFLFLNHINYTRKGTHHEKKRKNRGPLLDKRSNGNVGGNIGRKCWEEMFVCFHFFWRTKRSSPRPSSRLNWARSRTDKGEWVWDNLILFLIHDKACPVRLSIANVQNTEYVQQGVW